MAERTSARQRFVGNLLFYLAVVVVSAATIWVLSADARREVDALAVANADSTQWSLAQSEVEFLAFANTARAVLAGGADLQEARKRFDVFYSRMQILKSAQAFTAFKQREDVANTLAEIEGFLEKAIPIIDAADTAFLAQLPVLVNDFAQVQGNIRSLSLVGVGLFAERSEAQREAVSGALTGLGVITLALLALLLAVVGILLIINRASQRQTAKIAQTQSRLQAIISTSLDAVLVVDTNGQIVDFNGAAEDIFRYSREEAIGSDMAELVIPDHMREAHSAGTKRYRTTGGRRLVGSGLQKLEAKRKDGSVFPVELSVSTAESEENEFFVYYIRDISKRVTNENELVEARDKALAGEKAKADLLAVMSHEMRTPLNGVLGTLELLANTNLDEKQRKFVRVMDASGKMLMEHVNNVLDISRVDAGMADVAAQVFDVLELTRATLDGLRTPAALRGNQLTMEMIGPQIGKVISDRKRLQQILFNLVGNAIKFTENGTITLELEAAPGENMVEFRVIDTGIGITETNLDRIFDDFVTLDTSYRREVEGTGLGLGIVKRLVQLLGGEVGAESVVGEGSVFWFRIPLERTSERTGSRSTELSVDQSSETALDILIVEDNEINRMVAREMLENAGCTVAEANDGQDGVRAAEAHGYDLILMDISMPKLDGTAATEMIRAGKGPNASTPIVAITAHALPEDVARFRAAGMDDVITKPLSSHRLRAIMAEYSSPGQFAPTVNQGPQLQDVVDTLGSEKAEALRMRALEQIESGLGKIADMADNQRRHEDIRAAAHKLAGAAALFGMDAVWQGLNHLEMQSADMTAKDIRLHVADLAKLLTSQTRTHE